MGDYSKLAKQTRKMVNEMQATRFYALVIPFWFVAAALFLSAVSKILPFLA